ncbi:Mbov_0397 family ICE element conjugal transfer ATPase [Mycoplasma tauri]|uniref:Mbov_0397 family ICE element conjugal transfer ATPase n=1 Tax=Mycoplasma tauri TaxID=547987 RepID=UPI001CBEA488|nr:DUF87 domain-containing protein [Mycoplasma tauri]MBZ4226986.1 DUF87 domain-containing protein [Mycoplasma tauri]
MLQPKRLKYKKALATRKLSWRDIIEFFVVFATSYLISFVAFWPLEQKWKWLIMIFVLPLLLVFIFPAGRNNCKVYQLIIRMFKFKSMPRKYKRVVENNKERNSSDLNPYSTLISKDVVKNKSMQGFIRSKRSNNYFSVLQINGQNIWAENEDTQMVLVENFARLLDSFKYKFSFVKLDEEISYSQNKNYLDKIREIKNKKGKNLEFWNKYYDENIKDFESIERKDIKNVFYLIINAPSLEELEEAFSTFNQKLDDFGIFTYKKLEEFELLNFLNKLNKFNQDEEEIKAYLNSSGIYESEYSLDRIFKYDEVSFNGSSITINDDQYSIKCVGATATKLNKEWLEKMFNSNGTIIWNAFPYNDPGIVNKIVDSATRKNADRGNLEKSFVNKYTSSIEEDAIVNMIDQIQTDNFKLYDMNIFIVIKGNSKSELKAERLKIRNNWLRSNFGINDLVFRQFEGFLDAFNYPSTKLDREYFQITSINTACGYPFNKKILNDGNNLIVGKEVRDSAEALVWNMFKLDNNRTNHNVMILGTPGMGKSTFTKKILTSAVAANNIAIVIDPQAEYLNWAKELNGQIIDLGAGTGSVINPLQVRAFIARDDDNLETIDINALVNNHLSWLSKFFKIVFDDVNNRKWSILENQIINLYEKWGIYELDSFDQLEANKWPTISDLITSMRDFKIPSDHHNKEERKREILDYAEQLSFKFEDKGSLKALYNGHTNILIDNDVVVFKNDNLTDTNGSILSQLGIMILLSLINEYIFKNALNNKIKVKEYKKIHNKRLLSIKEMQEIIRYCAFCIDEEHLYINQKNITTLDYIADTTKLVRKLDCGTIHTTQNPSDYKQSTSIADSASRIIENCLYSFFFGLKDNDINAIKTFYKNSNQLLDSEIRFIASRQKGKVLATITNNERYKINLHYNKMEKEMFFDKGE